MNNLPTTTRRGQLPSTAVRIPTLEEVHEADCERLPALRQQLAKAMEPAGREPASILATALVGSIKIASSQTIVNQEMFLAAMTEAMAEYPLDLLELARKEAIRRFDWLPSVAEMVKLCDELMRRRRRTARFARIRDEGIRGDRDYFFLLGCYTEVSARNEETVARMFEAAARGNEPKREIRRERDRKPERDRRI
jgi:hypothetical protein